MTWYNYLAAFFSGVFLSNAVPHFVSGISGDRFPTPFAKPPGRGLSSPTVNVVWALFNLAASYTLSLAGKVSTQDSITLVVFFSGIAMLSILMSMHFTKKDAR